MLGRIEALAKAGFDEPVIALDRRLGLRPSGEAAVDWTEKLSDERYGK
jgi:hypothetical protein